MHLGPFSKAGQVTGSVRPNGKGRLMAGEGDAEQEPEQAAEDEGFAARALPAPPQPTPEMVASHNVSHIPFRSWCAHCVRGRGKSFYHRKVSHEADDPSRPVVSLDYGFFGAPEEIPADSVGGSKMPVLVVRDRFTKGIFTHLVPSKGTEHFYPEAALLRDVKFLGYSRLVLKADQEPSILALANAVKNTLTSNGIDCQLESSPKGDSHGMSNGEAESAVGITQGLARTLKDYVEHKSGKVIDPKSPLLGWLIEHVGTLYTLYASDENAKDGLTPYRKIKGTLHYHHLGNVFITVLGLPTSWMFDGTLVYFLVFVYILLRRSLVPQKVWLWFSLLEESLKTSNGMWSYYSLFKVHHGHQTHQRLEVHEKHWNCQSHWLFQLNNQMLHQRIRRQHLTKHISNVYIFDRMILIDLDIQQDAKPVHSYAKV